MSACRLVRILAAAPLHQKYDTAHKEVDTQKEQA